MKRETNIEGTGIDERAAEGFRPTGRYRLRMRIGVATAAIACSLVAAELGLRLFRPISYLAPERGTRPAEDPALIHRWSEVPNLTYELVPGAKSRWLGVEVNINQFGMRDREPLSPDEGDPYRILTLGDSVTFGWGVEESESFPTLIERMLNESKIESTTTFDVLNLGVSGYSTYQEVSVLEHIGLHWRPRAVILGYVLNDPEHAPSDSQPLPNYFGQIAWWRYSHLARAIAKAKLIWDIRKLGSGDYNRYLHAPSEWRWRAVESSFRRIGDLSRPDNIPVLVVVFPLFPESWDQYPYTDLHGQVVSAAEQAGLLTLDLLPAYRGYDPAELRLSRNDGHPSPLGHRVAASAIHERLVNDILPLTLFNKRVQDEHDPGHLD